jgi:putative flippase GtrA
VQLGLRWLKFNFVGLVGVGVQLAALWLYVHALGLHYLLSTALAVETAVLHNFAWHERWTWKDRAAADPVWTRLWRFHVANGLVSIAGNVALMRLFAGRLGMEIMAANVASIAVTSVANFLLGEFFVFRGGDRAS